MKSDGSGSSERRTMFRYVMTIESIFPGNGIKVYLKIPFFHDR